MSEGWPNTKRCGCIPGDTGYSIRADIELLTLWRRGDHEAALTLLRRHHASLIRFFELQTTRSASPLASNTFEALYMSGHSSRPFPSFRALLFRVAYLQLLHHIERCKVTQPKDPFAPAESAGTSMRSVFCHRHEHRLLLTALVDLTPEQRTAVQLYYWERMTTHEVSAVLDVDAVTVSARLIRARRTLRETILQLSPPCAARTQLLGDLAGWVQCLVDTTWQPPDPPCLPGS